MSVLVFGPIEGAQRILTVYDDHIVLQQVQNFRSFLTNDFFNGDKELYYCDMISCQFKEGSSLILGYLQFEVPGMISNRNNFSSENSFTFEHDINAYMYKVYTYVKEQISAGKTKTNVIGQQPVVKEEKEEINNLDELLKMKKLLDAGAITKEEYQEYKKKLLAL